MQCYPDPTLDEGEGEAVEHDAVVIYLSGGVVTGVTSSVENMRVIVVDVDDISNEAEYYAEKGFESEQDMLDKVHARFINL